MSRSAATNLLIVSATIINSLVPTFDKNIDYSKLAVDGQQ